MSWIVRLVVLGPLCPRIGVRGRPRIFSQRAGETEVMIRHFPQRVGKIEVLICE